MQNYEQIDTFGVSHTRELSNTGAYTAIPGGTAVRKRKSTAGYLFIKRTFDFFAALVAIALLSPVFLTLMVLIKLDSKGPVFYKHKRVGRNGSELYLYKFRSMVSNAQEVFDQFSEELKQQFYKEYKLDNDPRITRFGAFLRKTSLDELPQLFNILQGKLSFIGPRPVVEDEAQRYGIMRNTLLSVTPGLSGYWQINGRSLTTYEERMEMELYYVKNASPLLDLQILFKTVGAVVKCVGAK